VSNSLDRPAVKRRLAARLYLAKCALDHILAFGKLPDVVGSRGLLSSLKAIPQLRFQERRQKQGTLNGAAAGQALGNARREAHFPAFLEIAPDPGDLFADRLRQSVISGAFPCRHWRSQWTRLIGRPGCVIEPDGRTPLKPEPDY